MRIALVPIGSHGDVLPVLALARRLHREGHDARLISGDDVAGRAAEAGLPFRSIGLDVRRAMADHRDLFAFARRMSPAVTEAVAAEDVDAVLATFLGVAAGGVARDRGLPFFYAVTVPGLPTREFAYPTTAPRARGGRANLATHRRMARIVRMAFPASRTLFAVPRPVYLHSFSTHVVPRPADWEPFAHVTGYWFGERRDWEPEPALRRFLDEGPRPLCVTFGSTVDGDPRALARILAEALRRTGRRAVVVAGWSGLDAADLPDGVLVVPEVPFDWLFDRVSAVVHHGGAGTTALALRAGLPQVLVPSALDQPFWAHRLHALGVAPPPVPRRTLTADRLVAALEADDGEMRRRALELGALIGAEDGTGTAVRIIEEAVAARH
jgi:sterol 3beta-glucosyltransferase